LSPGEYVAAAYGVVLVVLLAYVAIIAAKLARIQRQLAELLELTRRAPSAGDGGTRAGVVERA
jgi:hypothetical protein